MKFPTLCSNCVKKKLNRHKKYLAYRQNVTCISPDYLNFKKVFFLKTLTSSEMFQSAPNDPKTEPQQSEMKSTLHM